MVRKIDTSEFKNEVLTSEGVIVVDFSASWCGPCQMLSPILDDIDRERDDFKIFQIDIDEENVLAAQEGIMSVPTLQVYKNGQKVDQIIGLMPKDRLLDRIGKYTG